MCLACSSIGLQAQDGAGRGFNRQMQLASVSLSVSSPHSQNVHPCCFCLPVILQHLHLPFISEAFSGKLFSGNELYHHKWLTPTRLQKQLPRSWWPRVTPPTVPLLWWTKSSSRLSPSFSTKLEFYSVSLQSCVSAFSSALTIHCILLKERRWQSPPGECQGVWNKYSKGFLGYDSIPDIICSIPWKNRKNNSSFFK